MKKVLFIAFLYPPIINSGTQRSVKFSYYLPDFGWEPTVFTITPPYAGMPNNDELNKEIRPGTKIIRVPLQSEIYAKKASRIISRIIPYSPQKISEGIEWRLRKLMRIPDVWASWIPPAVREGARIFENEKFDLIYASGFPWSSFVIAKKISKITMVPYVLDFRDLWSKEVAEFSSGNKITQFFSKHLEKRIIKNASAIITTTESFANSFGQTAHRTQHTIRVITNGFDPNDFVAKENTKLQETRRSSNSITIVYTGVWKQGYSPAELYQAMALLKKTQPEITDKINIITAGYKNKIKDINIRDNLKELGPISHAKAVKLTQRADALFLPVSQGPYSMSSLPGKLFDYLGSRTPIIASVPKGSESEKILSKVGGNVIVPPGDIQKLAKHIEYLVKNGTLNCPPANRKVLEKYERRNLTHQLAQLFNSVMKENDN